MSKTANNYVPFHLHTDRSLGDSATAYRDYVDRAVELSQPALAFTEHGNTYSWVEKKRYCDEKGIKYLHGVEVYLTEHLEPKVRDNFHTILIAKNHAGVLELNSAVSRSSDEAHFYYSPRLSFEEFFALSKNVIKISACLGSPLNRYKDKQSETYERLCRAYDYYEVQPHTNSPEQKEYNRALVALSARFGTPLIAGTDTHSLNAHKAECRTIRQRAKGISFDAEDEFDLTYKTPDELRVLFLEQGVLTPPQIDAALDSTLRLAESVEPFELDTSFKYPKPYADAPNRLRAMINERYAHKAKAGITPPDPAYLADVKEEYRVLEKLGMLDYMLFVAELVDWCRQNDIPVGPGRGSVAGSKIAYLTDITDVDPGVWHTLFSRFANEDRKEIGDIDLDFAPAQREQIYEHIIQDAGEDCAAFILAVGTVADKGSIDEIGRAQNLPLDTVDAIKSAYAQNPDAARLRYPELFYYFDGLVNTAVSQSMHPAGIVVSPITLSDNYGIFHRAGKRILCIDMDEVHELGLVKYDILGLVNIAIIHDACKLIGIPCPKAHEVNWDDPAVWDDIHTSPVGIFQFEKDHAFTLLARLKPRSLSDLFLLTAAIRPSGASYRDRLVAREINQNPSKEIDELLSKNYGFLVFQEDTLRFLTEICGLSGSEADNVRRAIGRKQKERLEQALPAILEGYCAKSNKPRKLAEAEVQAFLRIIEDSKDYQFNYSHAVAYSMISYLCAWLRLYYPLEFITAYLNNAQTGEDIAAGTELARRRNIAIRPIQFRHSRAGYIPDKESGAIYKGIGSVKHLNAAVAEQLYALRDIKADNFTDLIYEIARHTKCTSRQLSILIKLDFFKEFGPNKKLLAAHERYGQIGHLGRLSKASIDKLGLSLEKVYSFSDKETEKTFLGFRARELLAAMEQEGPDDALPMHEQLDAEREYLGYCTSTYDAPPSYYMVTAIEQKHTPFVTLYRLCDGETTTVKCQRTALVSHGVQLFSEGDILEVQALGQREKSALVDGKWQKTGVMEPILKHYSLIRRAQSKGNQ